jgi:hypothetical protein
MFIINSILKIHMKWLEDNDLIYVMDGFKEFLWHVVNPWCHRCYVIPSAKVEGPNFYNQLLFLQIKRLQHSNAPSKEVSRCICWVSRFYQ